MKIRYYCLGLVAVAIAAASSVRAISSQPVSVESKRSQCQRFEAEMARFNENLTAEENDRNTQLETAENLLVIFNQEIQRLEKQTFQDAKLQALHQQNLAHILAGRDNIAVYVSAVKRGETTKADAAYGNLQQVPYQLAEVIKQFDQYCRKP